MCYRPREALKGHKKSLLVDFEFYNATTQYVKKSYQSRAANRSTQQMSASLLEQTKSHQQLLRRQKILQWFNGCRIRNSTINNKRSLSQTIISEQIANRVLHLTVYCISIIQYQLLITQPELLRRSRGLQISLEKSDKIIEALTYQKENMAEQTSTFSTRYAKKLTSALPCFPSGK